PNSNKAEDSVFFAYQGVYNVKLIAASRGGTSIETKSITIEENSPFAAEFDVIQDGYNFTVNVTTPDPTTISWLLPTGETPTEETVSFYWPFADTAKISLTVLASNGRTSTRVK